jgi:predicted ABC-type ATPase
MRKLIAERKDFMIESNLSKSADYDWIDLISKNEYESVLYFLGTSNVEINKIRVKARVLEGGHNVADPIIEQRYHMGLTYLKGKLINFFEATLIDVSSHEPRLMALLRKGRIVFKDPSCPP